MKTFIINNLEFAQTQQKLIDTFKAYDCERLAELLAIQDINAEPATIRFELTCDCKRFRQPSLHLNIRTKLPVICQRCLDEMMVDLDLNFDYLISEKINEALDENDEMDWLEANNEMNLLELIEDELLMAMPIAPAHEKNCNKLSMQSGEKPNPFAILKDKFK
jgi:uncharacterized protein